MKKYLILFLLLIPAVAFGLGLLAQMGGTPSAPTGGVTPTYIQSASGSYDNVTLSSVQSGNFLVICMGGTTSLASTTVSGGGLSYDVVAAYGANDSYMKCWTTTATGTGNITFTGASLPSYPQIAAMEIQDGATLEDEAGDTASGSSAFDSSPLGSIDSNAIYVGFATSNDKENYTWTDGDWTRTINVNYHSMAYSEKSATDTMASEGTMEGTDNSVAIVMIFTD